MDDYKSFKIDGEGYNKTARAFQVLFYVLATISTVAILDWYKHKKVLLNTLNKGR